MQNEYTIVQENETHAEIPAETPQTTIPWTDIGIGGGWGLTAAAAIGVAGQAHRKGVLKDLFLNAGKDAIQEKVRDRFRPSSLLKGTRFEASSRGRKMEVEIVKPDALPPAPDFEEKVDYAIAEFKGEVHHDIVKEPSVEEMLAALPTPFQPEDVPRVGNIPTKPELISVDDMPPMQAIAPTEIEASEDTYLKRLPEPSDELASKDKLFVRKGATVSIIGFRVVEGHWQVELEQTGTGYWWIWHPAWHDWLDTHEQEDPIVFDPLTVDWTDFRAPISRWFTAGEACHYSRERIPTDPQIMRNICRLAEELDKLRDAWGSALIVTSWYRPPAVNARVSGARNSQHLYGLAADLAPANGKYVEFEKWADKRWDKALGYGARSGRRFTHFDLREGRIRWNY